MAGPVMLSSRIEIVLVEDNPSDLELTLHALKKLNLSNHIAILRDGAEALDYFFETPKEGSDKLPKVIMLDLKLPKVDGLEVLKQLKGHPKTRTMPVVILTSSREERDLLESYQLGVNSYIVKPVDFKQFIETVQQLGFYWYSLNQVPEM